MKRILTFWLPILAALLLLSFIVYRGMNTYFESEKFPITVSDHDIYRELQEPLIGTVMYNGKTLRGDGNNAQVFEYSFNGHMTELPYRITLSRNAQFNDCASCIGDWEIGMFSSPEYNGEFISLKKFVVQMIYANGEDVEHIKPLAKIWRTKGFTWIISPDKDGAEYFIEVTSPMHEKWMVRV